MLKFCEFISQKDLRISTHVHTPNSDKLVTIHNFVISNAAYDSAILLLMKIRMGSGQFGCVTREATTIGSKTSKMISSTKIPETFLYETGLHLSFVVYKIIK